MSCSRDDLCDICKRKLSLCFKICLLSFVLSHSSDWNRLSSSEEDRNIFSQWMTLVCSRPSSVLFYQARESSSPSTSYNTGQRYRLLACLLTEFTRMSLKSVSVRLQQSSNTHILSLTNPQYLSTLTWNLLGRNGCFMSCPVFVDHYATCICSSVLFPTVRLIMTGGFYYLLFIPLLPSGSSGSAYSINFSRLNVFIGIQRLVW